MNPLISQGCPARQATNLHLPQPKEAESIFHEAFGITRWISCEMESKH